MSYKHGVDPAGDFLVAAGDSLHRGNCLRTEPAKSATTLAESAPQIKGNTKGRRGPGINLRKVADVLEEEGLDPTVEIVRVVKGDLLDPGLKAKVMLELLSYVQPKLKSVEINATVTELSPEERQKRLAYLLGKANGSSEAGA